MLGLTQQQVAELVGVTYQQAHKYEKGANRIAVGRLYRIARALGVEPAHFFEGLGTERPAEPQERRMPELARDFLACRAAGTRRRSPGSPARSPGPEAPSSAGATPGPDGWLVPPRPPSSAWRS